MCKRLGVDVEEAIDQRPRGFLTVALENLDVCGKWRHEDYVCTPRPGTVAER